MGKLLFIGIVLLSIVIALSVILKLESFRDVPNHLSRGYGAARFRPPSPAMARERASTEQISDSLNITIYSVGTKTKHPLSIVESLTKKQSLGGVKGKNHQHLEHKPPKETAIRKSSTLSALHTREDSMPSTNGKLRRTRKPLTDLNQSSTNSGTTSTATIPPTTETSRKVSSTTTPGSKFVVPKIVHVTWFYPPDKVNFHFHMFISLLSAYRFLVPEKIMFWCNNAPQGFWWEKAQTNIPVIQMVHRNAPTSIFGNPVNVPEHQSDIVRLEAVMRYGGIYMDLDMIILKSFDPLRVYDVTMGLESPGFLANGMIIAKPNATFLTIWHDEYRTFKDYQWAEHSVMLPYRLWKAHPNLIHVEERYLQRPNWMETNMIFGDVIYDWSKNYAMHLAYRFHKVDHNLDDIKYMHTTMAEVFRYVYYGTTNLFTPKYVVPKIVHLTWTDEEKPFTFHHFICLLAIQKHVKPKEVMLWYKRIPEGYWWNKIRQNVTSVKIKDINAGAVRKNSTTKTMESPTDTNIEALVKYGGIHLDWNTIAVASFDDLLWYNTTLSFSDTGMITSNILVSTHNSKFLKLYLDKLKSVKKVGRSEMLRQLAIEYPHLVHLEQRIMFPTKPTTEEVGGTKRFKLENNIAINLGDKFQSTRDSINGTYKSVNTPECALYRYIYHGDMRLINS